MENDSLRFERLVEQYQEAVLRTCFLYLRDQSLAEDAVQETFLKGWLFKEPMRKHGI